MLSSELLRDKAKPWLRFLDELQSLGIEESQLPVPQIAVFGDQSSGKSSLLESISGIPFPKGIGLVTKCPTRISMVNSSDPWTAKVTLPKSIANQASAQVRSEIENLVSSPKELVDILLKANEAITSSINSSNSFSQDTIHVQVSSPYTPDLTLVDLPGIIRTTTNGQDRAVINEVDSMLSKYMQQPETVILAVIPANQDIATVDILERANNFDPLGERTIGVLTKPDLVDQGGEEEILSIVNNIRKPLKLGYIMVKNRSQMELKSALSLEDAIAAEDAYFSTHPHWQKISSSCRGIKSLSDNLTNLIIRRAMDRAPFLKFHLTEKQRQTETLLADLGTELPKEESNRRKLLVKIISRFTQTLRQIGAGDYRDALPQQQPQYRLKFLVNSLLTQLQEDLKKNVPDLYTDTYADKLANAIHNMRGRELPGFGSTRLLLSTVAEELDSWRMGVEDTVAMIFNLFLSVSFALADALTAQYPGVNNALKEAVRRHVNVQQENMARRVEELFLRSTEGASSDQELIESINNLRFARFEQALEEVLTVAQQPSLSPGQQPNSQQHADTCKAALQAHILDMLGHAYISDHSVGHGPNLKIEEARAVLTSYWRICEKKVNEEVSAATDVVLLQQCSEKIEQELHSTMQLWISDPLALESIFAEDEKIASKRAASRTLLNDISVAIGSLDTLIPGCIIRSPFAT